jgi:hypothetical protein
VLPGLTEVRRLTTLAQGQEHATDTCTEGRVTGAVEERRIVEQGADAEGGRARFLRPDRSTVSTVVTGRAGEQDAVLASNPMARLSNSTRVGIPNPVSCLYAVPLSGLLDSI